MLELFSLMIMSGLAQDGKNLTKSVICRQCRYAEEMDEKTVRRTRAELGVILC